MGLKRQLEKKVERDMETGDLVGKYDCGKLQFERDLGW